MTDELQHAQALRCGSRVIYVTEPGEIMAICPDRKRAIVAHPGRPPKFVHFDGTEEPFTWTTIPSE
ncbi:hypothetical protein ACVWWG_007646 [Bradyrhizobium sp. LB7.2]